MLIEKYIQSVFISLLDNQFFFDKLNQIPPCYSIENIIFPVYFEVVMLSLAQFAPLLLLLRDYCVIIA